MKTGRNEPCPCGSGKKFKHCCMLVDNPATAVGAELKEFLGDANVNSLEEAQALAAQFMNEKNHRPQDDFLGLSPEQVHHVLVFPFEPSPWFSFPKVLAVVPQAPILFLVQGIANAIDDKGLKATATGKLPQTLCKALFEEYKMGKVGEIFSKFLKVSKEDDFYDLNVARLVMGLSGLLRKTKGRFYLTKKYHKVMSTDGTAGLYPILFENYCVKFNWAYGDGYDEIPFVQHSFLFSMHMLNRLGDSKKPLDVYQNHFLQAFPMVLDQIQTDTTYSSEEDDFRHCYTLRVIERFLWFMGLANLEYVNSGKDSSPYRSRDRVIEKLPLLDAVVQFDFSASLTRPHYD